MHELLSIIKGIELFRGLEDDQLQRLAAISQRETYKDGDLIFAEGSPGDSLYIIAKGEVEVQMRDGQGDYRATLYLGVGQVFGEVALLDEGVRSAAIAAASPETVVYRLTRAAFQDLCAADLALGFLMMRNLALDLAFKLRHRNYD